MEKTQGFITIELFTTTSSWIFICYLRSGRSLWRKHDLRNYSPRVQLGTWILLNGC
ncbi:hypothetical protein HanLR1_Chr06g0220641 [Helianthus annuus]|nr:hypothetical protein HanHA89_Chr06g0236701 [Helianthus annuus]KAJ0738647.1 hypothetical protein HanLR1_Chr06g0220641 [Helianthus annuus]